ncbi:MAG: FAD-dependent oxidoreductase [Bacteroidota bacterium]
MAGGKIAIIGGGVMGLTTAHVLLNAGYQIDLFTHRPVAETTSSKAAAIWLPYMANPVAEVNRWSQHSFHVFRALADDAQTGISMVDIDVLVPEEKVWWLGAIPGGGISTIDPTTLPPEFPLGYQLHVPLIETQLYLPYLQQAVLDAGARITFQEIANLDSLADRYHFVINCTGLGARTLVNDDSVYPVKGQLLKVDSQPGITPLVADFAFDEAGQDLAYIIPRQDYLVLGGTAIKNDFSEAPDPSLTEAIFARCQQIIQGRLQPGTNVQLMAGLRPARPSIRLEATGNIIHNYGHGGAGFTVSWGCAEEVLALIKRA